MRKKNLREQKIGYNRLQINMESGIMELIVLIENIVHSFLYY